MDNQMIAARAFGAAVLGAATAVLILGLYKLLLFSLTGFVFTIAIISTLCSIFDDVTTRESERDGYH